MQNRLHFAGSSKVISGDRMSIQAKGSLWVRVPKPRLHGAERDARAQQFGGVGVAESVEPGVGDAQADQQRA